MKQEKRGRAEYKLGKQVALTHSNSISYWPKISFFLKKIAQKIISLFCYVQKEEQ